MSEIIKFAAAVAAGFMAVIFGLAWAAGALANNPWMNIRSWWN